MSPTEIGIHMASDGKAASLLLKKVINMIDFAASQELKNQELKDKKNSILAGYVYSALSLNELAVYIDDETEIFYQIMRRKMLLKVDSDFDLGNDLGVANELSKSMKEQQLSMTENRLRFNDSFKRATPEQVDQFFQQRELSGDQAAQKWFLETYRK